MERIAFLWNGSGAPVYWRTIILCLGALVFVLMLSALRLWQGRPLRPVLAGVPVGLVLALAAGRIIHWYCCFENYESFRAAMTGLRGGCSMIGVIAGAIAACLLMKPLGMTEDLPGLLDDAAAAGALGIAVGRLGEMFGGIDHGRIIFENEALHRLPFSSPVPDAVSGAVEWRMATFCWQSLWAGALFLVLILRLLLRPAWRRKGRDMKNGSSFLLFLMLYCLSEVLLDSTRYDALFLRSNGFVSLEQFVCCAAAVAAAAAMSVKGIRAGGFRRWYPVCWALFLGGFGLAGYMEYYVQRHGSAYVFSYSLMLAGLAAVFIGLWPICRGGLYPRREPSAGREEDRTEMVR